MPEIRDARLAVLIDADNTSASHADNLLEEVAKYGTPTVKRAYGDWTDSAPQGLEDRAASKQAIQPMQQFAYTTGKNSTDSALIIDAMDLLYSGNLERSRSCPATATSPGSPSGCASPARRSTAWAGARRRSRSRPPATGSSSSRSSARSREPTWRAVTSRRPPLPNLRKLMTKAVESTSQDDGWSSMSAVGNYLVKTDAVVRPPHLQFAKLSTLAKAQDYLEVEPDRRVQRASASG